jgi:glucose-6-phosphate isomerase
MKFDPGFSITPEAGLSGFIYGTGCFGPPVEKRTLNDIRQSLLESSCQGPETVYAIAMDVGKIQHKPVLQEKMLLYGAVIYASGKLGNEPVRSQGHIHRQSRHSGWSPPEVYEIWSGSAVIYMQEYADDFPGRCFAVYAKPGDVVVVPPEWAHATISADPETPLIFGAWCDREYNFLYDKIRARKGLAWYALLNNNGELYCQPNPHYQTSSLVRKTPADYTTLLDIEKGIPIYTQFEKDPGRFQFISKPALKKEAWKNYTP